jgi:hypothetical protein
MGNLYLRFRTRQSGAKDALLTPLHRIAVLIKELLDTHDNRKKKKKTRMHRCPDAEKQNLLGIFTHRNKNE